MKKLYYLLALPLLLAGCSEENIAPTCFEGQYLRPDYCPSGGTLIKITRGTEVASKMLGENQHIGDSIVVVFDLPAAYQVEGKRFYFNAKKPHETKSYICQAIYVIHPQVEITSVSETDCVGTKPIQN